MAKAAHRFLTTTYSQPLKQIPKSNLRGFLVLKTTHMDNKRSARSHYKIVNGEPIPKKVYETELDAVTMARFLNSRENVIHKMVAYKCSKCNKWHIGNNGRFLTREDKEKYNEKLKFERHYIK